MKSTPDQIKASIAEQVAGHQARNAQLVALIVERGGLLNASRPVDLHFWSDSREVAESLVQALLALQFQKAHADPSVQDGRWSVEATVETTVQDVIHPRFVEQFVVLAMEHSSVFDGWGTQLSESGSPTHA